MDLEPNNQKQIRAGPRIDTLCMLLALSPLLGSGLLKLQQLNRSCSGPKRSRYVSRLQQLRPTNPEVMQHACAP
jgi:hypothetical protein